MHVTELPPLRVVPHQFTPADLCSGHVVLDFINTAAGLNRDPRDWLDSYARLVEWATLAGICNATGAQGLLAKMQRIHEQVTTRLHKFVACEPRFICCSMPLALKPFRLFLLSTNWKPGAAAAARR